MKNKTIIKSFKLPKEFGNKWLKALRSGEYEQYKGGLADYDEEQDECFGHCCLGVASSIAGMSNKEMRSVGFPCELPQEKTKKLPDILLKSETKFSLISILSKFNDGTDKLLFELYLQEFPNLSFREKDLTIQKGTDLTFSFEEIADFIEDNVLFV